MLECQIMREKEVKTCQNCKSQFTIEPEDFEFYEKIKVPPPTFCPECRFIRRAIFWNNGQLFRKKDVRTGQEIFSTYPEESPIKIYDRDFWWSDGWDALAYGRDYDFNKPFFAQFEELLYAVPAASKSVKNMVNSDYCNQAGQLKNCYLCFNAGDSENCLYSSSIVNVKDSVDMLTAATSELCYNSFFVVDSYQVFWSVDCNNCKNVYFSYNCENCSDCFGCVNLKHKQYYIFNKSYTKEEYEQKLKEFNLGSYESLKKIEEIVFNFRNAFPRKFMTGTKNVDVVGDYVDNSKNAKYCMQALDLENARYAFDSSLGIKDVYDYINWGNNVELMYETVECGENCRNLRFTFNCWPNVSDIEYSMDCHSSLNLFGCVGLRNKQYCVFNKQYSKDDYENLVAKIKKHMDEMPYRDAKGIVYRYGEFFPAELSSLAYNESAANAYFPSDKEAVVVKGLPWRDINPREYSITVPADQLPDHINEVGESILQEVVGCSSCHRAYKITPQELAFYKKFSIPLSRLCFDCRHKKRLSYRNSPRWYPRACRCSGVSAENGVYKNTTEHFHRADHCPNKFETTYAPDRPEIVYCEACYNAEIA